MNPIELVLCLQATINVIMQAVDLHTTIEIIKRGGSEMNETLRGLNSDSVSIGDKFWGLLKIKAAASFVILIVAFAAIWVPRHFPGTEAVAVVGTLSQLYITFRYFPIVVSNWKIWQAKRRST